MKREQIQKLQLEPWAVINLSYVAEDPCLKFPLLLLFEPELLGKIELQARNKLPKEEYTNEDGKKRVYTRTRTFVAVAYYLLCQNDCLLITPSYRVDILGQKTIDLDYPAKNIPLEDILWMTVIKKNGLAVHFGEENFK